MAKNKIYTFKNGNTFTGNRSLVAAVDEPDHTVQISLVIVAPTKAAAIEILSRVGFVNVKESSLIVDDLTYAQNIVERGVISGISVIATATTPRGSSPVILLIPTENGKPELKQIGLLEEFRG